MNADPVGPSYRIAVGLEYDGTRYSGWQSQPHAPSIQDSLNAAFSSVANQTVQSTGAGRTDAGVHASGQVAHIDTSAARDDHSWLLGVNTQLPEDISLLWVRRVSSKFHARYSAILRGYRYSILNRPVRSALERDRVWWVHQPIDHERMQEAAQYLVGEHDFSAFRAAACQARSPIRTISKLTITRQDDHISIYCWANAFLHHMVRNIVGSLLPIGYGETDPAWIEAILAERDRRRGGITAPACGLCLTDVVYPPEFNLPSIQA